MIHGHGSDRHLYTKAIKADFSSNVWYQGLPKGLAEHLYSKMQDLCHYPEPDAAQISKRIADLQQLNADQVLTCNGASEAFYLLAQYFEKRHSYIVCPSFSEYQDAAQIFKHKITNISFSDLSLDDVFSEGSLCWLANPNNPDGQKIEPSTLKHLCEQHPQTVFVVDEAYGELCFGFESAVKLIDTYQNLVIVKSMTKAFAIPGLRLGYLLSNSKLVEAIQALKMPWTVNTMAIEAAHFILDHYSELLPNKLQMHTESQAFQKELSAIKGLEVFFSDCNYALLRLSQGKAADLKAYLVEEHGLLIRDASNFVGLNASYFRLALQEPESNQLLIEAIKKYLV